MFYKAGKHWVAERIDIRCSTIAVRYSMNTGEQALRDECHAGGCCRDINPAEGVEVGGPSYVDGISCGLHAIVHCARLIFEERPCCCNNGVVDPSGIRWILSHLFERLYSDGVAMAQKRWGNVPWHTLLLLVLF